MTVRKRLFWSNILMILVPVLATALVGLLCLGLIWIMLVHGGIPGMGNRENFERVAMVLTETVEKRLESGGDLQKTEPLLDGSGMALRVFRGTEIFYSYGVHLDTDDALLAAAGALPGDVTVSSGGRSLFVRTESIHGETYTTCLFGGGGEARGLLALKIVLVLSAGAIALAILLSILLTNRFLTKFVFRRIEEPLDILTRGVHQLRDGNLDFQIAYDRGDEFLPVCRDFNEMARRLKANVAQLQNEQRSRKTLIAGISHDIRSPLTSIQAYVEGLLDGVAKTPEAQKKYLTTIKAKAEDLEHIVSQLFLFSRLELGEASGNRVPVRLDTCVGDTVAGIQEEYEAKGLTIALALEPAEILADPIQIQRIVLNIAQNSLKYKEKPHGKLEIRLTRENQKLLLRFADDGPGVPEEDIPHLFELFYRTDPARRDPGSGSGLGLAIVAEAAAQCGGAVSAARSALGGLEICVAWREDHGENSDRRG